MENPSSYTAAKVFFIERNSVETQPRLVSLSVVASDNTTTIPQLITCFLVGGQRKVNIFLALQGGTPLETSRENYELANSSWIWSLEQCWCLHRSLVLPGGGSLQAKGEGDPAGNASREFFLIRKIDERIVSFLTF